VLVRSDRQETVALEPVDIVLTWSVDEPPAGRPLTLFAAWTAEVSQLWCFRVQRLRHYLTAYPSLARIVAHDVEYRPPDARP
jgi:hypothetical protein